jgi:hypothetical protein
MNFKNSKKKGKIGEVMNYEKMRELKKNRVNNFDYFLFYDETHELDKNDD